MTRLARWFRPVLDSAALSRPIPQRQRRLNRLQLAFTLLLAVPFILQISLAIALTGWLLQESRHRSTEAITSRLVNQIGRQVYDRLKIFLETPHTVNQINADAARFGQIDVDNIRQLELRFWRQIQVYNSLSSIGFGRRDGAYIAGDRRQDTFRLGHKDGASPEGRLRMYLTDDQGNPTTVDYLGPPNYDPRQRPWYRMGMQAEEGQWTDIFTYSAQPIYVISAVQAFYDEAGVFQGVVLADLILSTLNNFLQSLDVGKTGQIFIVERSGAVVATSTPNIPYRVVDNEARRIQATESPSPLIQVTAQLLWETFDELGAIQSLQQGEFDWEGERYYWEVLPYADPRGLDWLIVVVLPESDLAVDTSRIRSAVALSVAAFALSLILGWVVLRTVIRPVANLAAAAADVATGVSGERSTLGVDRFDNLAAVTMALNQMSEQLQGSLRLLEDQRAKLAEAQQLAQLGSWDYDVVNDSFSGSEELYRLFGLEADDPQTAGIARLYRRLHPGDRLWAKQAIRQAVGDRVPFEVDFRILQQDGDVRCIYGRGRPILDESGRVVRLMGTLMDITERKRAEAALAAQAEEVSAANIRLMQAKLELEHRNQDLDEFAHAVSHDLKAPLRAIGNLSAWIEADLAEQLPPDNKTQMRLLRQRVARMERLIDGLLNFARVGRSRTSVETVDLNQLLADVIDSLDPPEAVTVQIQPQMPVLQTRRLLLRQVFANLIDNSVKHAHCSDVTITVSAQRQERHYLFSVADNGPGIPPEAQERIFGIFQTLVPRDRTESNGVGLSLVKRIVEMEGGQIWVESQPGSGAVFRFTWPVEPS